MSELVDVGLAFVGLLLAFAGAGAVYGLLRGRT